MTSYVIGVIIFVIIVLGYQLYIDAPRKDSLKLVELLKQQADVLTWLIVFIVILLYLIYRICC